ncbi:MAG: L-serine ammonia-lyase, iron-sulfur-dependent, subunit alpha [Ardenticatenaceae bacterium]|nr:L-serine ammonia-lyase, iron-sulfur-dependent, subunit alpha [Ardenticatenaceae bacterium]MCB8975779.1 L-serine ammonia-lyase, iron-sulfur-dependent, subunit alpha [Ardenticatenaceae bacterium]
MRGPSSSHCAAAHRIGRLCLDLLDGEITSLVVEYDENGALKTTHSGQGTDMGLYSGILGYDIDDDRLQSFAKGLSNAGIQVEVKYLDYGAKHPNNYRLTIANEAEVHTVEAISTGGGMIEVQKIDGAAVCMVGDYYELLVFYEGEPTELQLHLGKFSSFEFIEAHQSSKTSFIEVKSAVAFDADFLSTLAAIDSVQSVRVLNPVLPILARAGLDVPFISCHEMLEFNQGQNLALWELAVAYESRRGNISTEEVFEKMRAIVRIMKKSIHSGLAGTEYQDRILPAQAPKLKAAIEAGRVQDDIGNRITLYTTAMMDVKSAMGVIVAAPTAGSCGTLPGAILGAASFLGAAEDDVVKAMLASGLIGVFIAAHATFAAEVAGCMAETGAGGAMAAAGLTHLHGGTLQQALNASAKALGASLGLVCDMIGDRVEVPCLDKNVSAAHKALAAMNMAVAGYTDVIPLDEVIDAMFLVGESMPRELCCTGLGGLAIAPTAQRILLQLTSTKENERVPGKFWKTC